MAEKMEEWIEEAEEAKDTRRLLSILAICTKQSLGDEAWEEPTEAALDAYYRLTKGSSATNKDPGLGAATAAAMDVIFSCVEAWQTEEAIVEVGLGIVSTLARHITGEENTGSSTTPTTASGGAAAAGDMAALIVTIMKAYSDEGTIQEQACLAVEGLAAASSEWKDLFLATPDIQQELSAAVHRITNERNKAYPTRAASALGINLSS